nr:hypothetical protein [Gordonia humi]
MIAVVVAVPTMWGSQKVVSADGFAASAAQAARDQQVQDYFASTIASSVAEQTSIPLAGDAVKPLAQAYTRSDAFATAFEEIARQQHDWLFTAPGPDTDAHVMDLNITPMINEAVASASLPVPVHIDTPIYVAIDQHRLSAGSLESTGDLVKTVSWIAVIVAVVAAILALALANRRGTVLAWLGVGGMLAAAVAFGVAQYIRTLVDDRAADTEEAARRTVEVVADDISGSLITWAVIAVIVGALVTVAGILFRIVGGGRRRAV